MNTDLRPLFFPSSLAVIGASADTSKHSYHVIKVLHQLQYRGKIFLVNKNSQAIAGEKVFQQVADIPGAIDLALIFVPAGVVLQTLRDCAAKGVKAAVVHGAGFAEIGEEGRVQQETMAEIARVSGMRIVGPNCMGIACPASGINMVITQAPVVDIGGFSFSGQSGWATEYALIVGQDRGLGFRNVVSCGNQADLTISDYLDYFAGDPETRVIGAYVEGFKDGPRFLKAAGEAAARKPVIIWKSGKTGFGARFTQSHTGSLAGEGSLIGPIMNQAGLEEAADIEDLLDAIVAFSSPVLPQGHRVGLLVSTGAIGVAACDSLESLGFEIPSLPDDVHQELIGYLKQYLPPFAGLSNPIDLIWAPMNKRNNIVQYCLEKMAPWVDALLVGVYPGADYEETVKRLMHVRDRFQKPILTVCPYGHIHQHFMRYCTQKGIPSFGSMERAVRSLRRLVHRSEWLRKR
ncbi:MAG: CoA-binding protein [Thermodesulfobacteriota bacterium]